MIHPLSTRLLSTCASLVLASAGTAQKQPNWLPHTPSWMGNDPALDITKNPVLTPRATRGRSGA